MLTRYLPLVLFRDSEKRGGGRIYPYPRRGTEIKNVRMSLKDNQDIFDLLRMSQDNLIKLNAPWHA